MGSKISNSGVKTPKEIEKEVERLEQNDYLNGNDLLYFFCQKYPIPPLEKVGETQEQLTSAEEHFADQMWLIGRAYAASPERYSYSNKGKPKEDLLDEEGYESFFQDIARMILREECHQKGRPIAFFRGNRVDINEMIKKLSLENVFWAYISDADRVKLNEWMQSSDKSAKSIAHDAVDNLCCLLNNQNCFNEIKHKPLKLMLAHDTSDLKSSFKNDSESIKNSAECVTKFAAALNSARKLRDIACILKTLTEINDKANELQEMPKSIDDLFKELFHKKWKRAKRGWAKLPERARLVVREEPSDSISFSSKFLHFHYPSIFFIYDTVSASKTRFTAKKNPKLVDTFEGYEKYRTLRRNEVHENSGFGYLDHANEELILSYFLLDYLLENRNNDPCRKLLERLERSKSGNQDNTHAPLHYTYITRLVDELVMNGDAEPE